MNRLASVDPRISRLLRNERPRVVDLFCGCGGISLGFEAAGFEIIGGVEYDPEAIQSHATNFHANSPLRTSHSVPRDILQIDPADVCNDWGLERPDYAFDIVVGGPPCQAFTRVGRAKLRSVAGSDRAHQEDPRANLVHRFIDWVREIQPLAILIENVPDMLNFSGKNVAEEICEALSEIAPIRYRPKYTLLNAAFYGVPQARERAFIVAYREDLGITPSFPAPTHFVDLPRGYVGSRNVALKLIKTEGSKYFEALIQDKSRPKSVSSEDAIKDLQEIYDHLPLEHRLAPGASTQKEGVGYGSKASSKYGYAMRNWPGHSSNGLFHDHISRRLQRDYETFRNMSHGDEYPAALKVAEARLHQHLNEMEQKGMRIEPASEQFLAEWKKFVPPYDASKFPNKWWKLIPDMPSRTLTAHIGKDTYSHIHYDSNQARTITVREAARIQSFPDGFRFAGRMNASFRQVGNSVPPLLVKILAEKIRSELEAALSTGP